MPRYQNYLESNPNIEADIIRESKDLIIEDKKEKTIDRDIETLIKDFKRRKEIDIERVKQTTSRFIQIVERLLTELEQSKRKAEQEENKKLQELSNLIKETDLIHNPEIRERIGKIEKYLVDRVKSELTHYSKDERRLRKDKKPRGYFIRKLLTDRSLQIDVAARTQKSIQRQNRENYGLERIIKYVHANISSLTPEVISTLNTLLKEYESDFDNLLRVEVDFEIEQAKLLHKIGQYCRFLVSIGVKDDLMKLQELRKRAEYWVKQDYQDSKYILHEGLQIKQLARHVFLDDVAKKEDLESVYSYDASIGGIAATFYKKTKDVTPQKAVLVLPGIITHRRQYDILSRRIAFSDYLVCAIDLPSQGSIGEWRMGLMSEYTYQTIYFMKSKLGIRKVCVLGHSSGGVAAMFSAACYNQDVENEIYEMYKELADLIPKLQKYRSRKMQRARYILS